MATKPKAYSVNKAVLNRKLNKNAGRYAKAVEMGLKVAGLYVQQESQKLVPVDTGILRSSAFTRAEPEKGGGFDTEIRVGYTAEYAIYVHEILTSYHAPPTTARFLAKVYEERRADIQKVFDNTVKKYLKG